MRKLCNLTTSTTTNSSSTGLLVSVLTTTSTSHIMVFVCMIAVSVLAAARGTNSLTLLSNNSLLLSPPPRRDTTHYVRFDRSTTTASYTSSSSSSSRLKRYLFGFGGGDKSGDTKKRVDWQDLAETNLMRQGTGEVASTATMMENFKKSQQLGKKTATLIEELSATTVIGNGPGGKVKVIFSGQQRPKGIEIDDAYLESISPDDLCADITAAMQDAHTKSTEIMQKKMQSLYAELGLPNL